MNMDKHEIELSAIVPVYNAGEKLRRCVDSILNQTYDNFELILIDDGSTDESAVLCDEYVKSDMRVSVIHIDNAGPFQARKEGVENARGEILTFSDADDWLEVDAFETAMKIYQSYHPDIVAYTYFYDDNKVEKNFYEEKFYSKSEIKDEVILGMMFDLSYGRRRLNPSLCCKLIQKDLYVKVTETVKERITFGEDAIVTYPAICIAKSLFICNKPLYHYSNNNSSCMHKFPLERIDEVKKFQDNITRLFSEVNMLSIMQHQIESYVRIFLSMMVKDWFGIELSPVSYSIPYGAIPRGEKVFIYGAGVVGKSYINELKIKQNACIVGWADRNYKEIGSYNNETIIAPELIKEREFNILLIAVFDEDIARNIKKDLVDMGIAESKIVWERPVHII